MPGNGNSSIPADKARTLPGSRSTTPTDSREGTNEEELFAGPMKTIPERMSTVCALSSRAGQIPTALIRFSNHHLLRRCPYPEKFLSIHPFPFRFIGRLVASGSHDEVARAPPPSHEKPADIRKMRRSCRWANKMAARSSFRNRQDFNCNILKDHGKRIGQSRTGRRIKEGN